MDGTKREKKNSKGKGRSNSGLIMCFTSLHQTLLYFSTEVKQSDPLVSKHSRERVPTKSAHKECPQSNCTSRIVRHKYDGRDVGEAGEL